MSRAEKIDRVISLYERELAAAEDLFSPDLVSAFVNPEPRFVNPQMTVFARRIPSCALVSEKPQRLPRTAMRKP